MRFRPAFLLLLVAALCLAAASAPASELIDEKGQAIPLAEADALLKASGLDALVDRSDFIVHARVGERTARWVNKNIESSYQIDVVETLKGRGPASFELTVLGGDAPGGAPIGQYVRGAARLSPGEEVILFLRTDTAERLRRANARRLAAGQRELRIHPESRLATSFAVAGGQKGKFNVLTLEDGSQFVTRLRPMPHILTDPVSAAMRQNLEEKLEDRAAVRKARLEEEFEAALDQWEAQYGVRPVLPAADVEPARRDPRLASPSRPLRRSVTGASSPAPRAENPAALPAEAYRPSIVTDPEAPEFAAADPKVVLDALPYNADGLRRPMSLATFESLIRYRAESAAPADDPAAPREEAR